MCVVWADPVYKLAGPVTTTSLSVKKTREAEEERRSTLKRVFPFALPDSCRVTELGGLRRPEESPSIVHQKGPN